MFIFVLLKFRIIYNVFLFGGLRIIVGGGIVVIFVVVEVVVTLRVIMEFGRILKLRFTERQRLGVSGRLDVGRRLREHFLLVEDPGRFGLLGGAFNIKILLGIKRDEIV